MVTVKITKNDVLSSIPQQHSYGAAGLDLSSVERVEIPSMEWRPVDVGISLEIPQDYAGFILPRSGLCLKKGLTVLNAPGLIDSDYRGPIKVLLHNIGNTDRIVSAGDRIAQLVVMKAELVKFSLVGALSATERDSGGFGSTDG